MGSPPRRVHLDVEEGAPDFMATKEAYVTTGSFDAASDRWASELEPLCSRKRLARFDFCLEKSALLVLDMQRFFLDPASHAFVPSSQAILPRVLDLVMAYNARKRPIIYTRHAYSNGEDPGIMGRWWGDALRTTDPLSELVPEIAAGTAPAIASGAWPGIELSSGAGDRGNSLEKVIVKNRYSAFHGTGLLDLLRSNGVSQVMICGLVTHLCCESTARDAFMNDLDVFFAIDGTASYTEELHLSALKTLAHGFAIMVEARKVVECT